MDNIIEKGILLLVFAVVFIAYNPVVLWLRANKTMKTNDVLSGVLHYSFGESSIVVHQNEEEGELPWDSVYKITSNKKYVRIFSNRLNAYIIPRQQMNGQYDAVKELAANKLERYRMKMK